MFSNVKVSQRRKSRARQAVKYWTKTRMAQATPIPLRSAPLSLLTKIAEKDGRSRVVRPVPPKSQRLAAQTDEVTDMTQLPFSYVGKLFMREGNNNYVGTAWVIGDRAIFSAAHCMFDDNGTFFDDVVFQPQYRNGNSIGSFAVIQSSVDERYTDFGNDHLNYDFGIGILDRSIGHLTGIAGYALYPTSQIARGQVVTGIGYPAERPFDGTKMFKSKGEIVRDSGEGTTAARFIGAENDMTGGCSGGVWVDEHDIAVGLNSFVFVGEDPPIMHSPYFGDGFENLIEWAKENGGINHVQDDDDGDDHDSDTEFDVEKIRDELATAVEALTTIANEID